MTKRVNSVSHNLFCDERHDMDWRCIEEVLSAKVFAAIRLSHRKWLCQSMNVLKAPGIEATNVIKIKIDERSSQKEIKE